MAASFNSAWETVCAALTPSFSPVSTVSDESLLEAVDCLRENNIAHIIEEWFFEVLQQDLRQRVSPAFWAHFDTDTATQNSDNDLDSCFSDAKLTQFCKAFEELHAYLTAFFPSFNIVESLRSYTGSDSVKSTVKEQAQVIFKAVLFFCPPKRFHETVQQFYSEAFRVFHHTTQDLNDEHRDESLQCAGCNQSTERCQCEIVMDTFHRLNRQLHDLGLLERISGEAVTTLIHQRVKEHVDHTCRGNFETPYLHSLEKWLEQKVLGWLKLVYSYDEDDEMSSSSAITAYKGRLYHDLYETYAHTRIEQLFNIIIEFPESEPALQDLKECLEKTDLRALLVKSLKSAFETRLLHPGVNTTDILTAYISAIRALRVLDTAGVILELVCEPVRRYLRSRDDTVRCIVSSLTDDGSSELSDELFKGQPLVLDESYHSDDDAEDWENWMPDPVDADPGKTSKSRRTSDIISMLVNIYGSKELFVKEYQTLLADRILTQFNYDTEREIRYLELLKLRFGEAQLHYCEVMLKDVADSRRINTHITDQRRKDNIDDEVDIPVNCMILSAQFWPTFREEKLELPEIMQKSLETYTKGFEALKGNRTLSWKPHLGLVNLEIEIKDKKLNMSVSPIHATILMHFQEKDKWTVDELSLAMHMPVSALRRKITFWQSQGLLREETTDTFVLVEDDRGRQQEVIVMDDEEQESAMASQQDQREEELQVLWSYIVGMLTNLETLPLERIHSMLKIFAMQGPNAVECGIPELKAFLDRKVKEQKLLSSGGVYRLPKPGS